MIVAGLPLECGESGLSGASHCWRRDGRDEPARRPQSKDGLPEAARWCSGLGTDLWARDSVFSNFGLWRDVTIGATAVRVALGSPGLRGRGHGSTLAARRVECCLRLHLLLCI